MEQENQLQIFNNEEFGQVKVIKDEKGEPLFELYSVGSALGYHKWTTSKGKEYLEIRKDRINKIIKNGSITPIVINYEKYISIDDVRKFITLSHTNSKEKDDFINHLQYKGYITYKEVFKSERKETVFFKTLIQILKPMNYTLDNQLTDNHYRLDGYIPELDLVIEYDENGHINYNKDDEEKREKYIKSKYKNIIRVSDFKDLYTNIGSIMNKIIELNK